MRTVLIECMECGAINCAACPRCGGKGHIDVVQLDPGEEVIKSEELASLRFHALREGEVRAKWVEHKCYSKKADGSCTCVDRSKELVEVE